MRRLDAVVAADVALECAADEPTSAAGLVAAPLEQYGLIGARLLWIMSDFICRKPDTVLPAYCDSVGTT